MAHGSVEYATDLVAPALPTRVPLTHSLRLRLSLLTTALVALVVFIFLAAINRELVQITRRAGGDRALTVSAQIANAMAQQTARGLVELRRLSDDRDLAAYLSSPQPALAARLQDRLQLLAGAGQPPLVLLNDEGVQMLRIDGTASATGAAATISLPSGVPSHTGIGPMRSENGIIYSDVVIAIGASERDDETGGGRNGFLVVRRLLQRQMNAEQLSRLMATGATIAIGNRTGGPWTDFAREVPAPPIDATRSGLSGVRDVGGERRMGAVTPIEGTPWAAWVDLPESLIMAPARTFLRRMIIIAFIAVSLAGIAVTLLSAHITRPLTALTEASASIAAGNYASPVTIEGRDEVGRLGEVFNAMADRVAAGRRELEDRVQQRTARLEETTGLLEKRVSELQQVRTDLEAQANELAVVNQELEAFSYSVSHDLRAPLRHVTGFAALLDSSAQHKLSPEERRHLTTIVSAAGRMGRLIDDLLSFSRTGRRPIDKRKVRLDDLVTAARHELNMEAHIDRVEWAIGPLPEVDGDYGLLELVMVNLVGNALKYTRHQPQPRIEIGARTTNPREVVVYVKDNGAGFDMQYVDRLFGVFQRLHTEDEFEGTGIGLASVRRIIHRHGGRTWAEGAVNQGATFYFSLPR